MKSITGITPRSRGVVLAVLNGMLTAGLDAAFIGVCAAMLWINGRSTVMDVSFTAMLAILFVGALLLAFRRVTSLRRRFGPAHPGAILAERVSVPIQIALIVGATVVWKLTDNYRLGWGVCFAAIAMVVGHALLLMVDVTTRTIWQAPSRQLQLHVRRFASIEVLHIIAGLVGVAGIFVTIPIHAWRPEILNAAVLLDAAAIGVGSVFAVFLGWTLGRFGIARPVTPES